MTGTTKERKRTKASNGKKCVLLRKWKNVIFLKILV